jgi:DNA polymerase I-like protein with 3'-5' exonuclease and polymerase domains
VVATVHDSIILEVKSEFVDEAIEQSKRIMTSWWSGDVPLKVDVEVGGSWGSLKPVEST